VIGRTVSHYKILERLGGSKITPPVADAHRLSVKIGCALLTIEHGGGNEETISAAFAG